MGRGKRREPEVSLLSFPFPSCPLRSLFLSPQPPHNTEGPLLRRERQRSHLVPGHGARVRYSLDTNENIPFFKYTSKNSGTVSVPDYKVETLYSGKKSGHRVSVFHCAQSTTLWSLLSLWFKQTSDRANRVTMETVTYRVLKV